MSNFLRPTPERLRALLLVVAASLGGTACSGSDGYSSSIEACASGDDTGVEATVDSQDENDPSVILEFVTVGNGEAVNDDSANGGWSTLTNDYINGLGEVVCTPGEEGSSDGLVFTPSGLEARQAFITENVTQNR